MSLAGRALDRGGGFTLLHHGSSAGLPNRLPAETAPGLCPRGTVSGIDRPHRRFFGMLHLFDTLVLVDPRTFAPRLEAAGFVDIHVDVGPRAFRFRARRPA